MSIRLMTLVWDVRWPTQNHLLVMLKLADHANDDGGKVWPAVATIATQAQCSERTVQNVLKALRDCGLASVERPGGGSSPTVYALNVDLLRALSGRTLEGTADRIDIPDDAFPQVTPQIDDTGATVAPPIVAPVQPATQRGANEGGRGAKLLHPNHHLEPSSKPPTRVRARSEGLKSDFGSEVGVQLTKANNPDEIAAWRRYADLAGGKGNRFIVRMIDDHGACLVPSLWPPSAQQDGKRQPGEAA